VLRSSFRSGRPPLRLCLSTLAVTGTLVISACSSSGGSPKAAASSSTTSAAGSVPPSASVPASASASTPASAPASASAAAGSASPVASATAGKKLHVAVIYYQSNVEAFQEMYYGAKWAAEHTPGVSFTGSAPSAENPAQEAQMFTSATQTSKDGIVLQTLAGSTFLRPVQAAVKAGIPVVAIDAPLPAGSGVGLFVSNDNVAVGSDLAKELLASTPADATGTVVIGDNGAGVPPLDQRVQGMKAEIAKDHPHLTIVGPITTGKTTQDNYTSWQGIVAAHPGALAYMAPSDADAASLALIEQKTGKKLNVGGCDLEPTALQGVKQGLIKVLVSPEHWLKGYVAMKEIIAHDLTGAPLPNGFWNTGDLDVDSSNVDAILARQVSEASRGAALQAAGDSQLADPSAHIATS
jgi:ABC-type sugar transport system substrate-binding protein